MVLLCPNSFSHKSFSYYSKVALLDYVIDGYSRKLEIGKNLNVTFVFPTPQNYLAPLPHRSFFEEARRRKTKDHLLYSTLLQHFIIIFVFFFGSTRI
jgi:hypothetical protein